MKIHLNTKHLIERAADRVPTQDGAPYRLAAEDLNRWRDGILDNAPDDWRFTERARDFVLTVVTESHQIKFLGASSRWTRQASQLQSGVIAFARALSRNEEPRAKLLNQLANLYLHADCDTEAEIHHELKTVYSAHMTPTPEFLAGEDEGSIVLAQSRVERNLAQRPNAILLDLPGQSVELWVRQGNPYVRAFRQAIKSHSFCIFARLTREGIEEGHGQLWKTSGGGFVYRSGEAQCWPTPRPKVGAIPRGFRSENYWRVPLHIDAWRHSLEFKVKKDKEAPAQAGFQLDAIRKIRERAKELNRQFVPPGR